MESNQNPTLEELLKLTFCLSILAASVDTENNEETQQKVGEIVGETLSEEIMAASFESLFEGKEFDFNAVVEKVQVEIGNDFEAVVDWTEKKYDTLSRTIKMRVLSAVYRVLLVDAVISDVENEFLNTILSQGDISLEEIKDLVDENKIAQKFIEEMNNELLAMDEEPDEISLEELFKISSIFAIKSAIVDTEENEENKEKVSSILVETISEEIMQAAFESAMNDEEEFDFQAVIDKVQKEVESDMDAAIQWADERIETLSKGLKIRILSAVYRILLVDDKFSEKENLYLNELLDKNKVSLDEIKKAIEDSENSFDFLNQLSEEEEE